MANEYILGNGVFNIGGTDVALTRGGGSFTIERDYKLVNADGDFGPVKGRIRKDRSVATLTMNALEVISENIQKMYPAMEVDTTTTPGTATITGAEDIADTDYINVTWTGKDSTGRSVIIDLTDAINLENIEWTMVDKDEIVPQVVYTATYDPTTRTTEPWKIEFVDA
jgi:hypothetical protein